MKDKQTEQEIEEDREKCEYCSHSQYKLDFYGKTIYVCLNHFTKWDNYLKGISQGKFQARKEVLEEEIGFLRSLPTQSGKASQYQRDRVKKRIEELKSELNKIKEKE